jgi:hypothetical protein
LLGGDGHQRVVVDRFDEAVAQRVERPQRWIFSFPHVLAPVDHRAIVDEGTSADARAIIDGMVGLTKLPLASVWPTQSELAGTADRSFGDSRRKPRAEDRSKPGIDVEAIRKSAGRSEAVTGPSAIPLLTLRDPDSTSVGASGSGRFGQGLLPPPPRRSHRTTSERSTNIFRDDYGSSSTHRSIRITIGRPRLAARIPGNLLCPLILAVSHRGLGGLPITALSP